ncbi:MAG TPA: HAD family hydrolase, partial [Nocardioides sp.]
GLRIRGVDVHAAIGMGGDKLVAHVAGDSAEWAVGDQVREAHDEHFRAFLPTLEEVDGASELLERLASSHRLVLASSGEEEVTHDLLTHISGAHHLSAIVSGSDVRASKPSPDLLLAAAQRVGAERPIVIGDAVWDARAAQAAGFPCIGLRTGGICAETLSDAGAEWIYDGPRDLVSSLDRGPLGSAGQ